MISARSKLVTRRIRCTVSWMRFAESSATRCSSVSAASSLRRFSSEADDFCWETGQGAHGAPADGRVQLMAQRGGQLSHRRSTLCQEKTRLRLECLLVRAIGSKKPLIVDGTQSHTQDDRQGQGMNCLVLINGLLRSRPARDPGSRRKVECHDRYSNCEHLDGPQRDHSNSQPIGQTPD